MTGLRPKVWNKWLALVEFQYNYHTILKMTPFKVLNGYDPPQLIFELLAQPKLESIDQIPRERQIMAKVLKVNLERAQNKMKVNVDNMRTETEFKVEDQYC